MESGILNRHEVKTVVVTCMDFRFHPLLKEALERDLGVDEYDLIAVAGGCGNLATIGESNGRKQIVLDDIELGVRAHHASRVVLLNHEQCGKYGQAGFSFSDTGAEREFHRNELAKAKQAVLDILPGIEVVPGYFHSSGISAAITRL